MNNFGGYLVMIMNKASIIMCKSLLLLAATLFSNLIYAQNQHIISSSGFDYTPDTLEAFVGETIIFDAGSTHPTLQVSEQAYVDNKATPLEGGFFYSDGSGEFTLENVDTIYYVCTAHLEYSMKGIIIVSEGEPTSITSMEQNNWYVRKLDGNNYMIFSHKHVKYDIRIFNMDGTLMRNYKTIGNHLLDAGKLDRGIYILQIQNRDNSHSVKFIVN